MLCSNGVNVLFLFRVATAVKQLRLGKRMILFSSLQYIALLVFLLLGELTAAIYAFARRAYVSIMLYHFQMHMSSR